jgi:WhiB family redox-sensing transcriptional regulator
LWERDPPDLFDVAAWVRSIAPAWTADAACRGADTALFFPEYGGSAAPAKAICAECPVRLQCLEFAIDQHFNAGIWGGSTRDERRRLRRLRTGSKR